MRKASQDSRSSRDFNGSPDNGRFSLGVLKGTDNSYSGFNFRKSLRLAGLYTYNGGYEDGIYAYDGLAETSAAWGTELKTVKLETPFTVKLGFKTEPSSGLIALWYKL